LEIGLRLKPSGVTLQEPDKAAFASLALELRRIEAAGWTEGGRNRSDGSKSLKLSSLSPYTAAVLGDGVLRSVEGMSEAEEKVDLELLRLFDFCCKALLLPPLDDMDSDSLPALLFLTIEVPVVGNDCSRATKAGEVRAELNFARILGDGGQG